jgi:hypothetical protein
MCRYLPSRHYTNAWLSAYAQNSIVVVVVVVVVVAAAGAAVVIVGISRRCSDIIQAT